MAFAFSITCISSGVIALSARAAFSMKFITFSRASCDFGIRNDIRRSSAQLEHVFPACQASPALFLELDEKILFRDAELAVGGHHHHHIVHGIVTCFEELVFRSGPWPPGSPPYAPGVAAGFYACIHGHLPHSAMIHSWSGLFTAALQKEQVTSGVS